MKITPTEFLAVMRGGGSAHSRALVVSALGDPESELRGWLRGVESWARSRLNKNVPSGAISPAAEQLAAPKEFRLVRKAAMLDAPGEEASIGDLLALSRSAAPSAEVVARVRTALNDPTSDLSRLIRGVERWAGRSFGKSDSV